ncbi:MAG TPA: RDD family protein [Pseudomonadales bacterium]
MTDLSGSLAGRGRRLVATLIDATLIPALTLLLVMMTGIMEHAEDYKDQAFVGQIFALAVLSYLVLNGYLLWKRGQTIGKWALKVAIVSSKAGDKAPLWKLIVIRASFFPLLFLIVAPPLALLPIVDQLFIFGRTRRCIHDYAAGTAVVSTTAAVGARAPV